MVQRPIEQSRSLQEDRLEDQLGARPGDLHERR